MGEGAADLPLSRPRLPPEAELCKVDTPKPPFEGEREREREGERERARELRQSPGAESDAADCH